MQPCYMFEFSHLLGVGRSCREKQVGKTHQEDDLTSSDSPTVNPDDWI